MTGAAVELDEAAGALERRRREAVEVEPLDADHMVGVREGGVEVAPVEHARPDGVRARVLVQHDLVLERLLAVEDVRQRLVVDLDELGGVARQLASARHNGGDGIAHVTDAAHRERVVLDVRARRGRELEEGIREDRDLVAGERSVDAVQLERLGDVDGLDARVRVRRANEMDVAHFMTLDVVEEDTLALDESLVFLARDALADEARFDVPFLDDERAFRSNCRLGHCAAALIASTMLT